MALNAHQTELFRLDDETLCAFSRDTARAAAAVQRAFDPDKINYAVYGDLVPHLHYHIVPKYRDGACWGKPFEVNPPDKTLLGDEGYQAVIQEIARSLSL
ncbi:MAG TPA: HIT domain-containing protein [Candidatus Methylomirabilis sp.]